MHFLAPKIADYIGDLLKTVEKGTFKSQITYGICSKAVEKRGLQIADYIGDWLDKMLEKCIFEHLKWQIT